MEKNWKNVFFFKKNEKHEIFQFFLTHKKTNQKKMESKNEKWKKQVFFC